MIVLVLSAVELETYLCGVVPAEMPASWPMEALKAQAVLARTYARYAVAHPRGREFQLYGDARGQVWNPALKALSSTVAVNETEGVYLVDEKGNPAFVEYVSKCGREDCPYCLSKAGHVTAGNPDGVWPTRVCQWGMKTLAERGLLYEDIIRHYLPDARFVTAEEGTE